MLLSGSFLAYVQNLVSNLEWITHSRSRNLQPTLLVRKFKRNPIHVGRRLRINSANNELYIGDKSGQGGGTGRSTVVFERRKERLRTTEAGTWIGPTELVTIFDGRPIAYWLFLKLEVYEKLGQNERRSRLVGNYSKFRTILLKGYVHRPRPGGLGAMVLDKQASKFNEQVLFIWSFICLFSEHIVSHAMRQIRTQTAACCFLINKM